MLQALVQRANARSHELIKEGEDKETSNYAGASEVAAEMRKEIRGLIPLFIATDYKFFFQELSEAATETGQSCSVEDTLEYRLCEWLQAQLNKA